MLSSESSKEKQSISEGESLKDIQMRVFSSDEFKSNYTTNKVYSPKSVEDLVNDLSKTKNLFESN